MSVQLPGPSSQKTQNNSREGDRSFFTFIRQNCTGSNLMFISILASFKSNPAVVVAIQDPYLVKGRPLSAPSYSLICLSPPADQKVRCCFYLLKSFEDQVSYVTVDYKSGDMCGISFQFHSFAASQGLTKLSSLMVINVYNTFQLNNTRSA